MNSFTLHLKDEFPFLGENGKDPRVEIMLPYNMTEMHRENQKRPCTAGAASGRRSRLACTSCPTAITSLRCTIPARPIGSPPSWWRWRR